MEGEFVGDVRSHAGRGMNPRQDTYMQAVVNYGINLACTDRVGACRYMAERSVPKGVIVRVLAHPNRRRV